MKTILVGINSKFSHTMLSVRCLASYAHSVGIGCEIREYTINNRTENIIQSLYLEKADVYAFSCYIFNIEHVRKVAGALKKLLPSSMVVFGGPEVSYETETFMRANPFVDFVLRGEGEKTFASFISAFDGKDAVKKRLYAEREKGVSFLLDNEFVFNGFPEPVCDLDEFPFPYEEDLFSLSERILYYESSRGCPFRCSYCLSSVDRTVRARSLTRVKEDLSRFLDAKVRLVKFVDRTFNYDNVRAFEIMKFLHDNDNGVTSFHFEIAAWRFTDEMMDFLRNIPRKNLFQFEVGIQSTNPQTLEAIDRHANTETLFERVKKLIGTGFHVHVDLICGLPYEDYASFGRSFNDVYSLGAACVQLGFLKVLKGAPISLQNEHGNVFNSDPPYEIMYNKYISFDDVIRLKRVEELVELYYNSGLCSFLSAEDIRKNFSLEPFSFFEMFSEYLVPSGFFDVAHKTLSLFDMLYDFLIYIDAAECVVQELCAYDFYRFGKAGVCPRWLKILPNRDLHRKIFSDPALLSEIIACPESEIGSFIKNCHRDSEVVSFRDRNVLFLYGRGHRAVTF